jgi:hypothetical protein
MYFKALLANRSTQMVATGDSPAQLLMSRKMRSLLPEILSPRLPDLDECIARCQTTCIVITPCVIEMCVVYLEFV